MKELHLQLLLPEGLPTARDSRRAVIGHRRPQENKDAAEGGNGKRSLGHEVVLHGE